MSMPRLNQVPHTVEAAERLEPGEASVTIVRVEETSTEGTVRVTFADGEFITVKTAGPAFAKVLQRRAARHLAYWTKVVEGL